MIINLNKEISVERLVACVGEQHGEKGLRRLAYRALQILINEFDIKIEPSLEVWLTDLKTGERDIIIGNFSLRRCRGCGEDFLVRDEDNKHGLCEKCDGKYKKLE